MASSVQVIENALLLQQAEQKASDTQNQNLLAVAPQVLAAIHAHNDMLLSTTVQATAPKGNVGASAPQAPVSDTPPYNPFNGGGSIDQLATWLETISNNPNDPSTIQGFLKFLLSGTVNLNDPQVQALLQKFGFGPNMIQSMIVECIQDAYFTGSGGPGGGLQAAQTFIANLTNELNGMPANPYSQQMLGALSGFDLTDFNNTHFVNGQYVWSILNPDGSGTMEQLVWTNDPTADQTDNFMITELIGNCQSSNGGPVTPNPYAMDAGALADFMRTYRTNAIETFWSQTKNLGLLVMYFMMMYDNDYQSQEGGLANTTNMLTGATNNYASPLLAAVQAFGTLPQGPAGLPQVLNFIHLLTSSTVLINMESQTQGFSSNWNSNVYNAIMNAQVSPGTGGTAPLSQFIDAYMKNPQSTGAQYDLVAAFNSLNPPPSGTSPSVNPGYQSVLSALQTGGGLITGTSKMVNTELTTVSNLDNQVIKLGNAVAASDGGGIMQMIMAIINNFASR
jgi:hypothetical protein